MIIKIKTVFFWFLLYVIGINNKGSFYSNEKIDKVFTNPIQGDDIISFVENMTNDICDKKKKKMLIYQVDSVMLNNMKFNEGTLLKNIVYKDDFEKKLKIGQNCHFNDYTISNLINSIIEDRLLTIFNYNKNQTYFLEKIIESNSNKTIIFQGLFFDDDKKNIYENENEKLKKNIVNLKSTTYYSQNDTFLTSGLFMCLFSSLFFFIILFFALQWICSIQITYSSFDKQINQKKNV